MRLGVAEVLERTSGMTSRADRIRMLQENDSPALRAILQGAFDPNIVWLLPEGEPPYKPNDLPDQHNALLREFRKFYLFVEGGNPNLKQTRREFLFIELLETLDPKDAKLLASVKDKHIPYPGVTSDVVLEAFPGLY
jgi:hypothetical protein